MLVYLLVVAVGSAIMSLTGTTPHSAGSLVVDDVLDGGGISAIDHDASPLWDTSSSRLLEPSSLQPSSSSVGEETTTAADAAPAEGGRSSYNNAAPTGGSDPSWPAAVEASVGVVAGEYTCLYDGGDGNGGGDGGGTSGSLYAGSRGLYFESWAAAHPQRFWLSFWVDTGTTVSLRWEQVAKVIKLDHGIRVQCVVSATSDIHRDAEKEEGLRRDLGDDNDDNAPYHDFQMHLVDLDRVWLLLISLQNDSIMGREPSPVASGRRPADGGSAARGVGMPPPGSMRRRNSDPLLSSMVRVLDESMIVDGPATATVAAPPPPPDAVFSNNEELNRDGSVPPPTLPSHVGATMPQVPKRTVTDSFVFSTAGLDMHDVERLAGKLSLQPIPCIHDSVKGKLYAGKAAVYFYGRKYFWDKREVFLQWDMIRQIRMIDAKTTTTTTTDASQSIHDAGDDTSTAPPTIHSNDSSTVCVGIRIVAKDGRELQFVHVDQADRVWAMLVSLHNENLTSSSRQLRRKSQYRQSLRRMNSDPTIITSESVEMNTQQSRDGEEGEEEGKAMGTTDDSGTGTTSTTKPRDDASEWAEIQASATYANVVVKELTLNDTTLDEIFTRFLQNDAECSLARFLASRGDSNLRESNWEASGPAAASGEYTRVVHYTHPVNAPLAPPTANARKEQRYRRYANLGLCLWTKTIVDDVPMTDCFYVADRTLFTVLDKDRVSVRMEFEITFVKSTMFKGIISRTTSSEVTSGLQAHAEYMSAILGDKKGVVKASVEVPLATIPLVATATGGASREPTLTPWQSNTTVLLLVLIVLLQLWVVLELREVKGAVRLMEQLNASSDRAASGVTDGTCSAR